MAKIANSGTRRISAIDDFIKREESKMAELTSRPPSGSGLAQA